MYRHTLLNKEYIALLGYGVTCSVYNYTVWSEAEVLHEVGVSILHLCVIVVS